MSQAAIKAYLQGKANANQPDKWIGLMVQSAPAAVYGLLKASYGQQFPNNWAPGYESQNSTKGVMRDFLLRKMREKADDAARWAFVQSFYNGIPAAGVNIQFALDYIKQNG